MFNIISIYSGTSTNSHLSTTAPSLKITVFLTVQSTYTLYIKLLYISHHFSKDYFAKAQEPAFHILNLLRNVFTLNIWML